MRNVCPLIPLLSPISISPKESKKYVSGERLSNHARGESVAGAELARADDTDDESEGPFVFLDVVCDRREDEGLEPEKFTFEEVLA